MGCVWLMSVPARMALWAWNSWPATHREQSVKREFSHRPPSSSASRQSGTFTMFMVFWPDILTESCTTLTLGREIKWDATCALKKKKKRGLNQKEFNTKTWQCTSQKSVSLSSGRRPLASSRRKSLRMNFLKPQSFPWTNRYALWLSADSRNT